MVVNSLIVKVLQERRRIEIIPEDGEFKKIGLNFNEELWEQLKEDLLDA